MTSNDTILHGHQLWDLLFDELCREGYHPRVLKQVLFVKNRISTTSVGCKTCEDNPAVGPTNTKGCGIVLKRVVFFMGGYSATGPIRFFFFFFFHQVAARSAAMKNSGFWLDRGT